MIKLLIGLVIGCIALPSQAEGLDGGDTAWKRAPGLHFGNAG